MLAHTMNATACSLPALRRAAEGNHGTAGDEISASSTGWSAASSDAEITVVVAQVSALAFGRGLHGEMQPPEREARLFHQLGGRGFKTQL